MQKRASSLGSQRLGVLDEFMCEFDHCMLLGAVPSDPQRVTEGQWYLEGGRCLYC